MNRGLLHCTCSIRRAYPLAADLLDRHCRKFQRTKLEFVWNDLSQHRVCFVPASSCSLRTFSWPVVVLSSLRDKSLTAVSKVFRFLLIEKRFPFCSEDRGEGTTHSVNESELRCFAQLTNQRSSAILATLHTFSNEKHNASAFIFTELNFFESSRVQ